ncbi:MAG: archease [Desulfatibacillum sp.]|nr:archease [Desulfatibacillum sp.]
MRKVPEYTLIDHTADYGLTLCAKTPGELYKNAALALKDLMLGASPAEPEIEHRIRVAGLDRTDLLINWLREILFLFAGDGEVLARVRVESVGETSLSALVHTEAYNPQRHEVLEEIKAVTYHQARVREIVGGWECSVIFDV